MLRMIQRKLKNKKGFTLVELIIVIAILGILTAIAVPKFSGFTTKAKTSADAANIKTIQNAVHVYEAEKGAYPQDVAAMKKLVETYLNNEVPDVKSDENNEFYMDKTSGKIAIKATGAATDLEVTK